MAKVIEDLKNKNEDLSINLVSNGKSSNETTTNIAQGLDETTRNSQQQEQKQEEEINDDDDEERANFSRPPSKKPAPKPKTG